MSKLSPERMRQRAEDLVRRIRDQATTKNEREVCKRALGRLLVDLVLDHKLLEATPATPGPSIAETAQHVREVITDPKVKETATAAKDAFVAGAKLLSDLAELMGKKKGT